MHFVSLLAVLTLMSGYPANAEQRNFTLTSPELSGQLSDDQVYSGFGCKGNNMSPALTWTDAPEQTKSFAVTVYDPDAPTNSGWWHWLIFDIDADVQSLPRNAGDAKGTLAPEGSIQSITDFGQVGFGGACPPVGDSAHRYIFTVYALDIPTLNLDTTTPPAQVGYFLNRHAIAKASVLAYYRR